ncbi:translation initiation factor eIF-2B subunit family protein [Sodiomyces alkalinus F11]|uniref:Translation initiation factor eIF-2B subunit family protein n=1 Tax=Sodiomyces alkalinus (strain CBS 110278 / VKM F-3762 / F11) TaxID=1314773 RepID=A0A3N2QAP3_SODAK|nr:translation initiation factor eIF-2B subunit family protein [Sodiomyces alkalinus F11]ROT43819.1 translation initiation factor eIF-2B subunit family protein [Sodiomyces alkalinus F11]
MPTPPTRAGANLVSRSVASCFLFKFPPSSKPLVALFRRSDKVSTYRHCLAPISGSVEATDANPTATVWRELNEETTLTPAHIDLFRKGKPYSFADESVGRIWTVHPFAFRLKSEQDEARIQLDWEHEGWEWRDPFEVTDEEGFGGVPFLAKSLRRVWFEMELGEERGRILREGLLVLQKDHESGARQLAGKALDVFRQLVSLGEGEDVGTWWYNVRFSAWHLWKNGRESMGAAILSVLVRSLAIIEQEVRPSAAAGAMSKDTLENVSRRLAEYANERTKTIDGVWRTFSSFLQRMGQGDNSTSNPIRILTLSSSSTILECLRRASAEATWNLDVRILESRPRFEGISMASKLASGVREVPSSDERSRAGRPPLQLTLYSDAAAAVAGRDVDVVLLGADLIDAQGAVSNKMGSLPAVLSARHVSPAARVVVLAEQEKILPLPVPEQDEQNDFGELIKAWSSEESLQVEVKNPYFEWVPPDLIDLYLFEDGEKTPAMVAAQTEKLSEQTDRLFAEE